MRADLFAEDKSVSFSTQVNVPFGVRVSVAILPQQIQGGKWVARLETSRVAFRAELEEGRLPGSSFIVVSSSTEDGEQYHCVAVQPEEFDRVSAEIESSVLRSLR